MSGHINNGLTQSCICCMCRSAHMCVCPLRRWPIKLELPNHWTLLAATQSCCFKDRYIVFVVVLIMNTYQLEALVIFSRKQLSFNLQDRWAGSPWYMQTLTPHQRMRFPLTNCPSVRSMANCRVACDPRCDFGTFAMTKSSETSTLDDAPMDFARL